MSKHKPMKRPYRFSVQLCDCRDGDFRGWVGSFYQVDSDGWVRCEECGEIPDEIGQPVPDGYDLILDVRHYPEPGTVREYEEQHYHMEP